ncbi:MAG TPA: SPW repeat protein [Bryobacteraceae bacterium]
MVKQQSAGALMGAKVLSILCLLAGIWLFISPWVYGFGFGMHADAWNSWGVGAAIFVLGWARAVRPASNAGLSWLNVLLGVWTFFSPWIYSYTAHESRFMNSVAVGIIVFVFGIASGMATARGSQSAGR